MIRKRRLNDFLFKLLALILTAAQVSSFAFPDGQNEDEHQNSKMMSFLNWGDKMRQGSEKWARSYSGKFGSPSIGTQREMGTRSFSGEGDASYYDRKSLFGSKSYSFSGASSSSRSSAYDGGCSSPPDSPANAQLRCSKYSGCQAECHRNYQFPNGERELIVTCKSGEWQIEDTEWNIIPPCEPICLPACQNKGICIAPNMCNCPDNFRGPQCQYESKPCLNVPPLPANSRRKCGAVSCSVECAPNHQFPDGSTLTNMVCKDGNWVPSRPDWVTVPDCEVICKPPCQNGGICLSFNMCQCPQDFRGQQCQYSADNCSPQKLGFNGGYNCTSSGTSYTCTLSCPAGIEFESPPVPFYSCDYASGIFSPSPIPQCKYGPHYKAGLPFRESSYESNSTEGYGMGMFKKGIKTHDVSLGVIPQTFIPETLVIEEKKPRSGSCFTWGSSHYKTFDGKVFDFTSSCLYTLVRDASDNTFSVSISNSKGCDSLHGCYRNITVFLEDREYVLAIDGMGDAIMALNGFQRIAIPSKTRDFTIESVGNLIILNLHSCGVTIRWNTKDFVQVDVTEKMWNKTAGLCGRIDGHSGNDLEKMDGSTPSSILEFANSWEVHELGVECTDSPSDVSACSRGPIEDVTLVSKAEDFCQKLLIDPKFAACRKVVNSMRYYEACKWDYCACEKSNPVDCGCQSISVYVQECIRNGVKEVADWRDKMMCPITCENGKVYSTCGPTEQDTCGTEEETVAVSLAEPASCIEGCFCPTGTVLHDGKCIPRSHCPCQLRGKQFPPGEVIPSDCNTCSCTNGKWVCTQVQCGARCASIGDPHYTTFDGRHYNFMGKCSYYLVKGDNYSIEAENVACAGSISEAMSFPSLEIGLPSCTKMITIHYKDQTIKLKQNREVSINGEEIIKVPFSYQGIKIRMVSSIFLLVELPNGFEVWWDGITRAYVDAQAHLQGKTKGLCGTFNQNQKDDFLTPEGDVEQSAISFANKWKTSESCADLPEKFLEKPCDVNVHKKAAAESHCQKLKGNIFQICHWLVDPEPFYQDCLYDMCSCEGKIGPCLCPILSAYAKECAKQGLNLDWRMEIRECGIHCPGNQRYQVCGNTCTRSCFDISSRSDDAPCKRKCAEGCNCPEGETLNSRGECIPISSCPCLHQGLEFQPGHKLIMPGARDSQLCICKNALWDCHHATPQDMKDFPSVESLRVTCSAINNEEFTDCEPVEPVTCKNMHKPPSYSSAKCTTGCKCKKGYVLDTYSKKCIKPSECPCHHGGRSYGESEKIQEDCNTCTCSSGKWKCTESVCAGICTTWGESHFKTFDGRIFDFHGSCDYIFAKGKINKQDSFEVMIQNVPCGSSGIACSKAVTLKVGSGDNAETITFSKDQGLPPYGGHKRITVRQAGLFVFAEVTDIGIVLQWDKGTRIYVKANPSWKNKIRGLCGNYNDNELDDFMTPSGGISEISPVVFGDSWKVHHYCPETYEVKDTCAIHPSRKVWALQKCGILKSEVFQPCHSEVPLDPYLERCIFDTCGCDMGGDCECLCTAVAAYAQECNIHGVPIRWRSQELCPMQCDETCAHYSPCVQTCPQQTCDNQYIYKSLTKLCNEDSCVEGCELKPCPEGEVYMSLEDLKCVPLSACKTVCMTIGNETYFEGDKMKGDDCHSCYCSRHEKICKGKPCLYKESTTLEYTTMYVTSPKSSSTSEYTTAPLPSSTTEYTTDMYKTSTCTTGWSPWISNDRPQGLKKPTDVEDISTISSHLVKKYKAICEPEHMINIECRVVGDHTDYKATGQNVLCSLEKGLICDPLKEKGKVKPCFDYEIRVYCLCEATTVTPASLQTLPPTVSEPLCITGWSPWFSNDKPVRFLKKYTDLEKIPDRITSQPDAYCARTQVVEIECRTVETRKNFDETGQNVKCNLKDGLLCLPSKGSPPCFNYEIRVYCLCEPTSPVTAITPSRTPGTLPTVDLSTLGEEVCITGWSPWFSNDRPVRFSKKFTDIERVPERIIFKPDAYCERSQVAKIECRTVGLGRKFDETDQNVTCNIEEGLVCQPSEGAISCLNYEIRVYCMCEPTSTVTAVPSAMTPGTLPTVELSTLGEEVCITGWSPWFSNDRPVRFSKKYNDIEKIPDRVLSKPHAYCERSKIADIQCRAVGTGISFDETGQDVRCNIEEGLVCNPTEAGSSCKNYEIRVFCFCEGTSSVTPVPSTRTPGTLPTVELSTLGEEVCITGWSPWFSNDRPVRFSKKYTDIETIPDRVLSKPHAYCERSKIADIQCRAVGTGISFDETGQDVRCNIEEGLVCNPTEAGSSCKNYEIRVFCLCEGTSSVTPVPSTRTPGTLPTVELSTLGEEVCITGWSPWFSNDRPVRFSKKYTDIETIPDRVLSKPHAYCERSKIADIQCRAVGTGISFDETGQDVRCNIEEGLVCNPTEAGSSCKNYEIRVFCLCEGTSSVTPVPSTRTPGTLPTVELSTLGEEVCITGWSPWFSNDRPVRFSKKYTDIETIPDRVLSKPHAYCERSKIADIQCRAVGTGISFDETGQDVRCNIEEGLVCNPTEAGSSCKNYEIRVFCLCEGTSSVTPVPSTRTPGTLPTVELSTLGEEVCITGWSPWFSNDRPVRFSKKYNDIEKIPDRVLSKPHAYCERSKIADIQCRAVGTGISFDETGQDVRCNIEEGLVCNPTEAGSSCKNYEIRVFCLCEGTSSVTPVPSTRTPGTLPTVELSTLGEEVCITGWSPWFSNDRPVRFSKKYTDIETIPDRVLSKPHAYCERSKIADIQCRAVGTGISFDETGQDVRCNIEEGLVCNPTEAGSSCKNYEIRVFCLCEGTSSVTPVPSTRTPGTLPTVELSTLGEEVCITGWSPWFSNDRPVRFSKKYNDIEKIPDRVLAKPHAYCERSKIADIQCRAVGTGISFDETGQDVRCNIEEGLVCNPAEAKAICMDYEIRVFCLCEPMGSTEFTPSGDICEEGLGMESGAIKDDQISVSSISTPGHLGNHARLNGDGAWIPESSEVPNEWIQVDLLGQKEVTGVIIQGNPSGRDWVKTFEVKWSDDGDLWDSIRNEDDGPPKEFQGNYDALHPKKVLFDEPVFAQYIKIIPTDFQNRISLRLEILGCDIAEATTTATSKLSTQVTPRGCDPAKPNHPHETDCYIFYHCADTLHGVEMVKKTCGPNMMYNPKTQTCDWPENVMRIRPDCSGMPPPPTVPSCKEGWTEWINVTDPKRGNGDYETLINIKRHLDTDICGGVEHISDIECRYFRAIPMKSVKKTKTSTKSGRRVNYQWVDYKKARQIVICKKDVGLSCNNYQQRNGLCMDYSVRFNCRCEKKVTQPTVMETKPTSPSTTSACPPGKIWKDCAIKCNEVCHHFHHILSQRGFCSSKYECISGCVDERAKTCPKGFYWRDYVTCLEAGDCTCVSHSGQLVKPGEVVRESDCKLCQCENNVYVCRDTCRAFTVSASTTLPNETRTTEPRTTETIPLFTESAPTVGTGESLHWCDMWTHWQDESNPEDGDGDFESVESLIGSYRYCTSPSNIECVTVTGNIPSSETGNEVTCSLKRGLQCYNRNNMPGGCEDYKIRIFCPCKTTEVVTPGIVTTPPTNGPSVTPKPCDRWSDWINDGSRSEIVEVENEHKTLKQLHEMGFCTDGEVVSIECKDVKTGLNYDETLDIGVTCTLKDGLLCRHSQQGKRHNCRDYKIRYFCSCGETVTTTITTIVTSRVTPPPECARERFIPLINGPHPLSDSAFSASSSKSPKHGPQSVRLQSLYSTESGLGWIPSYHNKNQFLQVDLGKDEPIYGIKVQGSEEVPDMYVTSYNILHSEDAHKFKYAVDVSGNPKLFRGPINNLKPTEEVFVEPFEARYVRINPQSWKNGIALRFELIGCGEISVTTSSWIELTTPEEAICRDEMGLENGLMKDEQIEVSSVFNDNEKFNVPNIRFNKLQTETQGGAWIPATNSINEWVKFDFLEPRNLTGVVTQGQNGGESWVESFKVMYSHDGKVWNPVHGRDGTEKEFAANFDGETPQENYFDRPIQAQFLKIIPLAWHTNIAMRVEVLGCFSPYPPMSTPVPPMTTIIAPEGCTPCPNLPIERLENCVKCSDGLLWDGTNCIDGSECQCYVGHIPYSVGAVYKTEDCKECVCKIGGESSCHDIKCPKCEKDMRAEMSPTCGCVCKPCPKNMRLCPTSEICIKEDLWCNGIEDCPDDEINCEELTTPAVSTTTLTECFIPLCPPGFKPTLSTVSLEFEESHSGTKGVKGNKGFRERLKAAKGKKNKITSVCPIYQCVPAISTTPESCPTPECPNGYDVQMLESPPAESCPPFKCVLHPPEEEVCNVKGRSFETFDGINYNYDICHHILATDSINGKWSIEVHKNCSSCPFYLIIKQDSHTIILEKDILVKYGLFSYAGDMANKIGYITNQFEVSKVGDILHFKSIHYGFWVNWDGKANARIVVSSKLLNSVSGLCGYYSNDKDDDRQMPDGTIAKTNKEFGDSWNIEGYETCEPKVCEVELQNKAWKICELAKKGPFKMCNMVMDIDKFISQCLETTCACLEEKRNNALKEDLELGPNWENECRCDALLSFATQCKEIEPSFDLSEWRIIHSCPAICPPGEVYKDCYTRECEPSCRTLMMKNACPVVNDTCFSGCFCADGLIRKGDKCVEAVECRDCNCDCFGDPHFLTFDRSDYTFNGRCTYVAARDIKPGGKHDFQVLAKNGDCIEKTKASCTHAITILFGEHYIHLKRVEEDGEIAVIIDGTTHKRFPFSNQWSKLEGFGGKEVTVLIPSIQLEVSYFFNNYAFLIRLPSHLYGDETEGLCGNCNKNKKDDLKKRDGTVTKDVNDFGRSWLTKLPPELGFAEEKDCEVPVIPPCPPLPPEGDPCLKAIMDESRFGECHRFVNPAPYLEACSKDICHSKDKKKTVCHTMEAYSRECAREGVCLDWNVDDLCPYDCPSGLVYHPCGSGCLETCENHESFKNKSSLCSMSSIDGCYCPNGKVWKEDKCVEVTMCRACDEEGHFSGAVWNPSECEECSCTDSTVTCKVKSCPSVETVCDSSMTPVKVSESEDECCPKFICVNETTTPSPTCDEPLIPECGYGQELKITTSISGCREYICVCVPVDKCEPLIGPVTLEAELDGERYDNGMTYVEDRSGCCPKMIAKCDKSLCSPPPKCPVHHTVVELPTEESKCCPDYSCSPPGEVCMYKSEYASEEELEAGAAWPIVSFKKLGEKWNDGPCKECTCVEEEEEDYRKGTKTSGRKVKGGRHLKKVFRASCESIRCPSAEEHPDSKDYVLKEVPVKGVCCPEIVRTACQDEGKIYQVGKEWSQPGEHCISHQCVLSTNASLVIKQFKIRQCERECDEGWEYQEPPLDSEKCCGQCKQVACMFGGKLHPIGSSWLSSDKCTTYYCREVDGIVQTQSIDVTCPREGRLYEDFKVEVLPVEGSCCNRTYKVACLIGEHELKEGETFVVSKCKKVFCALGDDGELSKQEVLETCNEDCQKGWEYIEPVLDSEKCCGECKQVACITEDNKLIPPGTKWTTNDGCTSHICEQKGEQLQITSLEEKCPSVDDCPTENIFFDKCCKRCNATEKCPPEGICTPVDVEPELTKGVVDENKDFHGRCLNPDPVPGFKECKGNCHSSTFFDLRTLTHQSNCRCCQATTTKSITVKVVCEDGYYYERKVTTPTGCACNTCESPEGIKSHTKSGTKTGYKPLILKDADA